jgi:hypothetical protein
MGRSRKLSQPIGKKQKKNRMICCKTTKLNCWDKMPHADRFPRLRAITRSIVIDDIRAGFKIQYKLEYRIII